MGIFSPRRVGVDLGATAVRVAEVVGVDSYGYAIVRRAATYPLREGSIVAGEVKQPIVVAQALKAALARAGVPRQGFVLGATSRFTALGTAASPDAVGPHERTSQIRLSRQEISPTVPLLDSAISWNLLSTQLDPTGKVVNTLNVALVLKREADELIKVCRLASVQPQAIDLSAAALLRALVRVDPEDRAVAAIVDVGASKTLVATRKGLHLRSLRCIPQGGSLVSRSLMGADDITYDAADERKRFLRLPHVTRARAGQGTYAELTFEDDRSYTEGELAILGAADQIIEEIAKSLAADAAAHGREMAQGIQLTGAAARLHGFAERLQARVGVPVVIARPWAEIQPGKSTAEMFRQGEADPMVLSDLSVAIGLALWRNPS